MARGRRNKDDLTPANLAEAIVTAQNDAKKGDPEERERVRRQGRMRYRLRRQALPHYVLAGLLTIAGTARLAVYLTGDVDTVIASVAALSGVVQLVAGLMLRNRIPHAWRIPIAALAGIAMAWLLAVGYVGFSWEAVAVLLVVGYAAALPWWRRHRIPNPTSKPLAAELVPASVPQLWASNVGAKDGPLAGSYLTDQARTKCGTAYTMQLRPGRQSIGSALSAIALIASGLRRDTADLVIDRHPSGDASRGVLQVITRSPIKETITFTGPQYNPATGTIRMGPFADGESHAEWRLYTDNSMWGGVIIGGPGSGKSRLTEALAISAAGSGITTIVYGDPQEGASSPALAEHADYVARGTDAILELLAGLERITKWRAKENAALGLEGFTPSPERPGIMAIIDECHRVFVNEKARALAEWIAREGRKVGVVLVVASQYAGLITFGGSEALRSAIMAGNTVVLRTASKTTKGILAGLEFDPADLPAIPGYAYLVDTTGRGRTAPFRGEYVSDPAGWLANTPQAPLDQLSANGFGPTYTERHERAAKKAAQLRAELEQMRAGSFTTEPPSPAAVPMPAATETRDGDGFGDVVAFPVFPTDDQVDVTDAQAVVLEAIGADGATPAEIRDATGWGETYVRRLLGELLDAGHIKKAGHGRYVRSTNTSEEEAS